ncbi:hypothetical protein TorRG33x02_194900, partial [Trema orientale]
DKSNIKYRGCLRANEQRFLEQGQTKKDHMYYLTLEASDNNVYEAKVKVKHGYKEEDITVEFVRLARFYPKTRISIASSSTSS